MGKGKGVQVLDAAKAPLDLLSLHIRIQEDEQKQRSMYQAAMSLWR
jgi:hypothetical protein